jgi:hypothetical protein
VQVAEVNSRWINQRKPSIQLEEKALIKPMLEDGLATVVPDTETKEREKTTVLKKDVDKIPFL